MPKRKCFTPKNAMTQVCEYIIDCENNEYDSYMSFCNENSLDPCRIRAVKQRTHVYALALIALGLKFPTE